MEKGILKKKILSVWVHLMWNSAFETCKTSKCLKPEHVLLFCMQETMSQNHPLFSTLAQDVVWMWLRLGKENVGLECTLKFRFKILGKQASLLARFKCSMQHLIISKFHNCMWEMWYRTPQLKNAIVAYFNFICLETLLFKKWVATAQIWKLMFWVLMAINTLMEKNNN